ncbi:MAG: hypothetical protein EBU77_09510 [Betaproteobacteria bacterium]|nr:hypothetical protein [Betaproteobacteria bacterium]
MPMAGGAIQLANLPGSTTRPIRLATKARSAPLGSLMGRVVEPGKFANWIAPPAMGINRQPVDFEYVRFN